MDEQGYQAFVSPGVVRTAMIVTPTGRRYRTRVEARRHSCNCPQFGTEGICKHTVWLAEKFDTMETETAELAERERRANEYAEQWENRGKSATFTKRPDCTSNYQPGEV